MDRFWIIEFIGFLFVVVVGTLLHFAYEASGGNRLVALLSPVNESVWEHLKLLFVPMLVYSVIEYIFIGSKYDNFIPAKAVGIIAGMITIVVLFYSYTGLVGRNYLWADILTFIIGVAVASFLSYRLIESGLQFSYLPSAMLILIALCFILFTFRPPHIALFQDPKSKRYGIDGAKNAA